MNFKKTLPLLFLSAAGYLAFAPSCANTSTPPSGGAKDTIPPVLLRTNPLPNTTNFKGKKIELKFNEYIKLNDPFNQIFLSPPQTKRPIATVRGKSVVVTFAQPLDSATTYVIQFGQSIADNNEGNPFGAYSFSFSTGNELDSLLFSGYVVDAQTLQPADNISILLHTNHSDTAVYKTLPRALGKTDSWGYFYLPNLKSTPYRLFAVEDKNRNHRYDPDNETVAFLDSLLIPTRPLTPEALTSIQVDRKDTLMMLSRPVEQTLYLFKEKPKRQVLREKMRPQTRMFFFTFNASDAQVIRLQVQGVDSTALIRERSFWGDTLRYWIRAPHLPDTLKGTVTYLKTDSLNQLSPVEEKFSLNAPKAEVKNEATPQQRAPMDKSDKGGQTHREDALKITLSARPEWVEQQGIIFTFPAYPLELDPNKMKFIYTTSRKEEVTVPFSFQKDSLDGCRYYLHAEKWLSGAEYTLTIPPNIFKDVYGFTNDSLSQKVTLPDPAKTGSISVTLTGGQGAYIVDLLPKTKDKVVRRLQMQTGQKGDFPYLTDGQYVLRITEDRNGNGVWDTGSLEKGLQPERVRYYTFTDGSDIIDIKDKRELEQTIDLDELFKHDVALTIPTKTSR